MKIYALSLALLLMGFLGISPPATAASSLTCGDAWTRSTPLGTTASAVYLTIETTKPDHLLGGHTPVAAEVTLHRTETRDGVEQMLRVSEVDLVAGKIFRFAPLGYHIMLTEIKAPLKAGDHFPLTLTFANAGDVSVDVRVRPLRAEHESLSSPGMDSSMGSMPGMGDMK